MKNTKNTINWFIIPTLIFERAHNFYNIIFDTHFESSIDMNGDEIILLGNMDKNTATGCITSSLNYTVSSKGVFIFLNAHGKMDDILNRVIPAGGKIKKPKTSMGEYGLIAHIQDSEGNIIGLHDNI